VIANLKEKSTVPPTPHFVCAIDSSAPEIYGQNTIVVFSTDLTRLNCGTQTVKRCSLVDYFSTIIPKMESHKR